MKSRKAAFVGLLIPVSILAGAAMSGADGRPAGPPPRPRISESTEMMVSGRDGKPIIGANGKPIMVNVGRRPPSPPPPAHVVPNRPALTEEQIAAAATAGPEMVGVPAETDAEKARRLAPEQARR